MNGFSRTLRTGRADRGEEGAVLIVWVLALVLICVSAALAVDLGNVGQTHQNAQDAADAAAVSGAQLLGEGQSTSSVVASIESYVNKNFGSIPGSGNVWNTCPAGSIPAGYVNPGSQNCISFNAATGARIVNVVIPPQLVRYVLGIVGGVSGTNVSATATASYQSPGGTGLLPVAVTAQAAGSGFSCIKGGANGRGQANCQYNVAPGDRGLLDSPRYRLFTTASNSGNGNNDTIAVDLAIGIDHNENVYTGGTIYCDSDGTGPANANKCPGTLNNSPSLFDLGNDVFVDAGNTSGTATNGLVGGSGGTFTAAGFTFAPRLAHPEGFIATSTDAQDANPGGSPASPTISGSPFGSGATLNGRQVSWYLLNSEDPSTAPPALGAQVYASCYGYLNDTSAPATYDVQNTAKWGPGVPCLASYLGTQTAIADNCAYPCTTPLVSPIFSYTIVNSPRFALVPIVSNSNQPGQSGFDPIVRFEAVYLDYIAIQGNTLSVEAWVFNPQLIQPGPAPNGGGLGTFLGGPFVVNLCSLSQGNC